MARYFVDGSTGSDANDGLDNIGVGLATATWDESKLELVQAGHGYTFASGDVIYMSGGAGATVGLYEVLTAGTNNIKLVATSTLLGVGNATDFAAGDLNAGDITSSSGPFLTIQKGLDSVAAGDTVWVRSSATYNEALTTTTVGTAGSPIVMEGYTTSLGDEGIATNDGTTGSLAEGWTPNSGVNYYIWKNFYFKDFTGTCFGNLLGDHVYLYRIRASGSGGIGIALDASCMAVACHSHNNTGRGITIAAPCSVHSCVTHDNASSGIGCPADSGIVVNCLCYNNSGHGISINGTSGFIVVAYNTVIAASGSSNTGILLGTGGTAVATCYNNTVSGFSGASGVGITASVRSLIFNNNVFDCNTPYGDEPDHGGGTTTDPTFVDAANDDYTPDTASPLIEAGFDISKVPGAPSMATQTDTVGALLRATVSAGGGLLMPNKRAGKQ